MNWLRKLAYKIVEADLKKMPPLSAIGISAAGDFFLRISTGNSLKDFYSTTGKALSTLVEEYLDHPSRKIERLSNGSRHEK